VHRRHHTCPRVGQQHRNAVSGHHRQRQSRCARDQSVCAVERGRAWTVNHLDVIAVYLIHPHHPVRAQADGIGQPGPVSRNRSRLVADMVAQVEAVEGR
jgi:hypothetical protein